MRRIILLLFIFLFVSVLIFSQALTNPSDEIYFYLDAWVSAGYVDFLPALRPYPEEILKDALYQVISKGDADSIEKAKYFLKTIKRYEKNSEQKKTKEDRQQDTAFYYSPLFTPMSGTIINISDTDFFASIGAGFLLDYRLNDLLFASADWNLVLVDKQNGATLSSPSPPARESQLDGMAQPHYSGFPIDMVADSSDMEIAGRTYYIKQSIHSIINVGDSRLYAQAGLIRSSYGPFYGDNIVLSPDAQHAVRYNIVYNTASWTYSAIYMDLVASNNTGEGANTGKHLRINSLEWNIGKNIRAGIFETVVWGPDFNLYYLIPLGELTYQQIYAGAPDNSLFGINFSARMPARFKYDLMVYVDDLEFYDMIKFNFNTLYKASLQTALTWTPLYKNLKNIKLEYMLITPYMYTHKDGNTYNYLNYTHDGLNLASQLPPNSDKISLQANIQAFDWLKVKPIISFTRHANGSEGIADIAPPADGSIFDPGYTNTGYPSFDASPTRFMTQDTIEKTLDIGLENSLRFDIETINLETTIKYNLEYIWNYKLNAGDNRLKNYLSISSTISW